MPELKLQQSRLDGRYDIIECLGRGSYAEIYVAHDNAASDDAPETVVIKALNMFLQDAPDEALELTLIQNFQNEAVALDRVRHPNIISRLGHGTAIDLAGTTFHYIVLEYLSGGDMAALSRSKPLSMERALFYLEQVCSGLAHAHEGGVIHRDIKPQNLLLTADRQVVKIADFGVARLAANEGAITRVGTNIYAAPEHNPLVQTGSLDLGAIAAGAEHLTPAADIYSLAKTTYALLAGESPRRFAQHSIKEMPASVTSHFWSAPVLRVLQKATQIRPDNRYQTVQEFWDDLADAAMPPTKSLAGARADTVAEHRQRPSLDLSVEPLEFTEAPPQPRFQPVTAAPQLAPYVDQSAARRPKIVVPVTTMRAKAGSVSRHDEGLPPQTARDRIAALPDQARNGKVAVPRSKHERRAVGKAGGKRRARPYLVALVLILAFAGMLLATHKYVTSHWNPLVGLPLLSDIFVIGREGVTTRDVNLRSDASVANAPIGLAEEGSRIKILATAENWYEVQVLQHGRAKADPFTSDRGWINKKFVRFE
ncbi:MAG TPA: serine/threonine protein kinase [Pyrinomonadaceae bacterium]|jgi:serine/threonine protein kinase|nr:serine/threonine protein kinase [Pyrinomonadaceae bacterium]